MFIGIIRAIKLTLNVEEDNFLAGAVVVLGPDDVLAAVLQLGTVDDEVVVVAHVALHELHALAQLLVVVVPAERRGGGADDSAVELDALPFVAERALGFDDEAWRRLSSVCIHNIIIITFRM